MFMFRFFSRFIGGTYGRIIGKAMVDIFGVHVKGISYSDFIIACGNRIEILAFCLLSVCFLRRRELAIGTLRCWDGDGS